MAMGYREQPDFDRNASLSDQSRYDEELLSRVVEETLRLELSQDQLSASFWNALRAVAARYPTNQHSLRPVTEDLVEAILAQEWAQVVLPQDCRAEMVQNIATSLHEDPSAHIRLVRLWESLKGAV